MKSGARVLFLLCFCGAMVANAQISSFKHVIVIIQENRSPDNLFQGLCTPPFGNKTSCSTSPTGSQYNIQTSNWLDNTSPTGTTVPIPVSLDNNYDPSHRHGAFTTTCDINTSTGICRMDGAAGDDCTGTCPTKPAFHYVTNLGSVLNPYLTMATSYAWANYMFQTNQGPTLPAHLFLFGGTSAPSADDDAIGTFAAENLNSATAISGCIATAGTTVKILTTLNETGTMFPCFDHTTLSDLLDGIGVSWKFYTPSAGSIQTAPTVISHICVPSKPTGGDCTGTEYINNVILKPTQVLTDIKNCALPQVTWINPGGKYSDHPSSNTGGGPSWVASIINAIGNHPKCAGTNEIYWDDTAILVTWDDWGGWYDHEIPTILPGAQGDYQYGFRVPFIVVSAYTPVQYVDNTRMDFGTILRFIEKNYGIAEGALNFADARSSTDLSEFFNLSQVPRVFQTISAKYGADYFIDNKEPEIDGDDY